MNAQGRHDRTHQEAAAGGMAALSGVQSCHVGGIGKHLGFHWNFRGPCLGAETLAEDERQTQINLP